MSRFPSAVFRARVTRKEVLSPDFVRISMASEELSGLAAPAGTGEGPVLDAYFKLLVPHPDLDGPLVPDLDSEDWHRTWFAAEPEERGGWIRTYTFRNVRSWTDGAVSGVEVDVDFVLHAEPGTDPSLRVPSSSDCGPTFEEGLASGMGPGAAWAASARTGDEITFIGPDTAGRLWASWSPGEAGRVVMAADETAVPAVGSVLAHLPAGCRADVVLEVPDGNQALEARLEAERAASGSDADLRIHWLHRGADAERGEGLLTTLRQVLGVDGSRPGAGPAAEELPEPGPDEIVWGTAEGARSTYAYLAGEASLVRSARRVCVQEAGMDKSDVTFMGYWRRGRAEG